MTDPATSTWIERLALVPHPEGGFYRETFRSPFVVQTPRGPRAASTAILYLLPPGGTSALHRVQADEVWHHYAGAPIALTTLSPDGVLGSVVLGDDLERRQHPQAVVPAGWWQAARNPSRDTPALVGCTVAPGFDFADFEMADADALTRDLPHHEALIRALCRRA